MINLNLFNHVEVLSIPKANVNIFSKKDMMKAYEKSRIADYFQIQPKIKQPSSLDLYEIILKASLKNIGKKEIRVREILKQDFFDETYLMELAKDNYIVMKTDFMRSFVSSLSGIEYTNLDKEFIYILNNNYFSNDFLYGRDSDLKKISLEEIFNKIRPDDTFMKII